MLQWLRSLTSHEKGFSLIEVSVAIVLLGVVGVSYLQGMATAYRTANVATERVRAQFLAQTQAEDVKFQDYQAAVGGYDGYTIIGGVTAGYTISVHAQEIDSVTGNDALVETGIQKITITVTYENRPGVNAAQLVIYKIDRLF
ncbi:MAG: prepilin-type N-terminal cleavage/methylation domain-containing protein [Chloroflexi bacterium]|nr:prepilin-type N-terminal cleavage/methylation domain-containing protein [Chloroflexota bacterium]